jgi:VIT1/CCC1 family predicted Fe2+/Mn2+ transporter
MRVRLGHMLGSFLPLAVSGSSELMVPIILLVVALGFVGAVIILLIGKGRAE